VYSLYILLCVTETYITAGGDFLGLCDQKSSYKHVADFGRLRSYGQFNSRTRPRVNRILRNQLAGDGTQLGGLSFALQALFLPPDSATQLHSPVPVSRHSEGI
jgi:hypothetical protein